MDIPFPRHMVLPGGDHSTASPAGEFPCTHCYKEAALLPARPGPVLQTLRASARLCVPQLAATARAGPLEHSVKLDSQGAGWHRAPTPAKSSLRLPAGPHGWCAPPTDCRRSCRVREQLASLASPSLSPAAELVTLALHRVLQSHWHDTCLHRWCRLLWQSDNPSGRAQAAGRAF